MLKLVLAVGLLAASGSLATGQSKGYVQAGARACRAAPGLTAPGIATDDAA